MSLGPQDRSKSRAVTFARLYRPPPPLRWSMIAPFGASVYLMHPPQTVVDCNPRRNCSRNRWHSACFVVLLLRRPLRLRPSRSRKSSRILPPGPLRAPAGTLLQPSCRWPVAATGPATETPAFRREEGDRSPPAVALLTRPSHPMVATAAVRCCSAKPQAPPP